VEVAWPSRAATRRTTLVDMTNTTNPTSAQFTDVRDMVVVHKVFRRGFTLIPRLVRAAAPGDTRRAAVVLAHARRVLAGLDMHHTGEDALLWPKLLERDAPDAELSHRMGAFTSSTAC